MSYYFDKTAYQDVNFSFDDVQTTTISCWVKPRQTGTLYNVWSTLQLNTPNTYPVLGMDLQPSFFEIRLAWGNTIPTSVGSILINNRWDIWYNIITTIQGREIVPGANTIDCKIYTNGIFDGIVSSNPARATPIYVNEVIGAGFRIGASVGSFILPFNGELCEFAMWSSVLTNQEIKQIAMPIKGMPYQIQPENLLIYLPMNDFGNTQPITANWTNQNFSKKNIITSQTTTNIIYGKRDIISMQ